MAKVAVNLASQGLLQLLIHTTEGGANLASSLILEISPTAIRFSVNKNWLLVLVKILLAPEKLETKFY